MSDRIRATIAMHGLWALQFYQPLFPEDTVPFRAMAAAVAGDAPDAEQLWQFQHELHIRRAAILSLVTSMNVKRGQLSAAILALDIALLAVATPAPENAEESAELRRQCKEMMRGAAVALSDYL